MTHQPSFARRRESIWRTTPLASRLGGNDGSAIWPLLGLICVLAGCGRDRVAESARQLQDPSVDVRRLAASTLAKMGAEAKPAISALSGAIGDSDQDVRRLAIRAVGHLGPESASCLPALVKALDDKELSVRLAAAFAVQDLDPNEKLHTAVLIDAMKLGEGGTIVAIGQYGERAGWAVPTLMSLLQDRRPGTRRIAADALRQIGPAAVTAADALRKSAKEDADDRVREAAQSALAAVSAK